MSFDAEYLTLWPGRQPGEPDLPWHYGTAIKLYQYDLKGLGTKITTDLKDELARQMPAPLVPAMLLERREYPKARGGRPAFAQLVLSGQHVRLQQAKQKGKIEEPHFPSTVEFWFGKHKLTATLTVFKKETEAGKYNGKGAAIIYVLNGQQHFREDKRVIRKWINHMNQVIDCIQILVDCDSLPDRVKDEVFLASRDRMRDDGRAEMREGLQEAIKTHQRLKELAFNRYKSEQEHNKGKGLDVTEKLKSMVNSNPYLRQLLTGQPLSNTGWKLRRGQEEFAGKQTPGYFKLWRQHPIWKPKECSINQDKMRVQFRTDVAEDYFYRDHVRGRLELTCNDEQVPADHYTINQQRGTATLNVLVPDKPGIYHYSSIVTDDVTMMAARPPRRFEDSWHVRFEQTATNGANGAKGNRSRPPSNRRGTDAVTPSGTHPENYPIVEGVYELDDRFIRYKFDEYKMLELLGGDPREEFRVLVNLENVYLQKLIEDKTKPVRGKARRKEIRKEIQNRWMAKCGLFVWSALMHPIKTTDKNAAWEHGNGRQNETLNERLDWASRGQGIVWQAELTQ